MASTGHRRSQLAALTAVALIATGGLAGCGEDAEPAPDTGFSAALGTIGDGVSPSGTGFGWVSIDSVSERERPAAADALGPGADDLLEEPGEVEAETGLDPAAATQAVSAGGSYTFAVRFDGVDTRRVDALYERAGAKSERIDGWTAFDLGDRATSALGTPLAVFGSLGSRAGVGDRALILGRDAGARLALTGGGDSPLSDPTVALAAECLGDVFAARTLPGNFTHNMAASPNLIAVGLRAREDSAEGAQSEVICAVDDSEDRVGAYERALEDAFAPGARDGVTGEPIAELVSAAAVETIEGDGTRAARAELTLAPSTDLGFVFDALVRGSLVTYLGAARPIPE